MKLLPNSQTKADIAICNTVGEKTPPRQPRGEEMREGVRNAPKGERAPLTTWVSYI